MIKIDPSWFGGQAILDRGSYQHPVRLIISDFDSGSLINMFQCYRCRDPFP